MSLLSGPDVSQWQGDVDWRTVAKSHPFGFTKATDGATFVNPTFPANWNGMRAAGLVLRGAYHFAQAGDPVTQARHFVDTVNTHGGFPPGTVAVLDAEVPLKANTAGWVEAWCAAVQSLTGLPAFRIVIYSSLGWFDAHEIPAVLNAHALWVADYSTSSVKLPPGCKAWAFWQYTQTGHTAGIGGQCDLSYFHGSKAQLRALGGVKSGTAATLGKIIGGALLGAAALLSAQHVTNYTPPKPKPPVVAPARFPLNPGLVFSTTSHTGTSGGNTRVWVGEIQRAVKVVGAKPGIYDRATAARVGNFQRNHGLPVTGVVGAATWQRLFR